MERRDPNKEERKDRGGGEPLGPEGQPGTPPQDIWQWGKGIILLVAMIWGLGVAAGALRATFLDGVNLIFHEAGHVIFAPLGTFLGILGGSLMQLLVPAACAYAFVLRGDALGSGLCGIWTGESLVGVAIYMADARRQALPLLGGEDVIHDWNFLLGRLGLLQWDVALAALARLGAGLLILASALLGILTIWARPAD